MKYVELDVPQLVAVLRDMAAHIEEGDSLEGSIEYYARAATTRTFEVKAVYRTGNKEGQGGSRIVGEID